MKLTFTDKLGYAAGGITDAANFTFMGSYLMFFLTTIAHINPATAGVLIAAGSVISLSLIHICISYSKQHVDSSCSIAASIWLCRQLLVPDGHGRNRRDSLLRPAGNVALQSV